MLKDKHTGIGFEIIVAIHNIQLTGILMGVAFPGSIFNNAPNWLQDNFSNAIATAIVLLAILSVSVLRTKTFHKVVTGLSIFVLWCASRWTDLDYAGVKRYFTAVPSPRSLSANQYYWHVSRFAASVWFGIIWLIFIVPVYLAAFVWPVVQSVLSFKSATRDFITYNNTFGVVWAVLVVIVGIVIYFVMKAVNNRQGIDIKIMFQELPPD